MNVGIIGSGAWGKALATLAAEAGHEPRIGYRGRPPGGFPGTPNLAALALEADLIVVAVPASGVREVVRAAAPGAGARVVIATRGLEPETGGWLSDAIVRESACRRVGAMAGPALAAEVMARRPAAMVAASEFDEVCTLTQQAFHSAICRVYTSHDLRGVELAGAMVVVLAVACGLADGLDLGVGVRGVIVTRGLAEATRLGQALGADPRTFAGLAGVGDLVACGTHPEHPGYMAGRALVRTGRVDVRFREEARAVVRLGQRHGVELPLAEAVSAICAGKLKPRLAIDALMRRAARAE